MTILKQGEKVFVITRRLFERDLRRHFVGVVEDVSDVLFRTKGYVFVYDEASAKFVKRPGERTRIFSLTDAGLIIILLPDDITLDELRYMTNEKNERVLSDGKSFEMNVSEFNVRI